MRHPFLPLARCYNQDIPHLLHFGNEFKREPQISRLYFDLINHHLKSYMRYNDLISARLNIRHDIIAIFVGSGADRGVINVNRCL